MLKSSDELRVRKAMEHSLAEWGVEMGKLENHERFYTRAIGTALAYCRKKEESLLQSRVKDLQVNNFPKNPEKAIEFVLQKEIEDEPVFRIVKDTLCHPFPPYMLRKDFRTQEIQDVQL